MLQTQNETHRSVSYREDLREQMVDIAKQKSPIKIKTLKERLIFFDKSKEDIEFNSSIQFEKLEEEFTQFDYNAILEIGMSRKLSVQRKIEMSYPQMSI